MKAQTTDRNTQIVNAYIAGNHNKTELARYFGVSASTIRRVLATVAVMAFTVTASVPAVAADSHSQSFLSEVYKLGTNDQSILNSWENLSYDEQQDVFAADPSLRQELKAPVKTPAHAAETEVDPVEQTITPPEVKIVLPVSTIEQSQPDHVTQTTSTLDQQQVRSAYYDKQITALNAEAEQNHAEVLSESHARFQADKQVLSESESYTNQKFSDLKSQVDDNKKKPRQVLLLRWRRPIFRRFRNHNSLRSARVSAATTPKMRFPLAHHSMPGRRLSSKCPFPMTRKAMLVTAQA